MAEIINAKKLNKKNMKRIAEKLKKGAVIIYPTETCYGIGCSIKARNAVKKISGIKGRKEKEKFVVIVSGEEMAEKYCKISRETKKLMKHFMPGALNLVVQKRKGKGSICFRIPRHKITLALAKELNEPLISTSCNKTGEKPIYSGKKAIKEFGGKIDIIIDFGILPKKKPSTVFDVKEKKVLREGEIKEKEIMKVLG